MAVQFYIVEDLIISIVMFAIINSLGAKGLPFSYHSFVNAFDEQSSVFNVGYRIFAPIVVLMLISLGIRLCLPEENVFYTFYSIVLYWIYRIIAWGFHKNQLQTNFLMLLAQAVISTALCLYLFCTAMQDPIDNLLPQSSDISLEFVIIVLFVLLQILSQSSLFRKSDYYWSIREKCESELYSFERQYNHLYSTRIKSDIALRAIVYTIALTENFYRPKSHRIVERILAKSGLQRFGIAKSTGLMQVKSKGVLSDEESVKLAIPIIEKIYDDYIGTSCRFSIQLGGFQRSNSSDLIAMYDTGYSYDLNSMLMSIHSDINAIYGKYSGSNLSDPTVFYDSACSFIKSKEYEQETRSVDVNHSLSSVYDDLAYGVWYRIGRNNGMAISNNKLEVYVCYTNTQLIIADLVESLKKEDLNRSLALLVNRYGQTIIAFVANDDTEEKILALCDRYGFINCGRKEYFFNTFVSDPNLLINNWIYSDDFA